MDNSAIKHNKSSYPAKDVLVRNSIPKAEIVAVEEDSPAWFAGLEPGDKVLEVNSEPLTDILLWQWLACDEVVGLLVEDSAGNQETLELERDIGQSWGIEFEGVIFDAVKQCRNNCTFCFMKQLPKGMRPSLYLRDDDFRLSFLGGTFVTLTNLTAEDEKRIVEQRLSPLRVSLQVVDESLRTAIMGPKAPAALNALDRLLCAGIQVHCQIVLVPEVNDGTALEETLNWASKRPSILSVGVVPLGFTKHQNYFHHSFNSSASSKKVLDILSKYQKDESRPGPWVFGADEFYLNGYESNLLENLPEANFYGDFELFEDGIGIVRSVVDDWREAQRKGLIAQAAKVAREIGVNIVLVAGYAQKPFLDSLILESAIGEWFSPLYVSNDYFGGNVNVTGLLCGEDIVAALKSYNQTQPALLFLPSVVFNDDGVTLDDFTFEDIAHATSKPIAVVSCSPVDYFSEIASKAANLAKAL